MEFILVLLITTIISVLNYKKVNRKLILKAYFFIMIFSTIFISICNFDLIVESIRLLKKYICIMMVFISILIYIIDYAILNIVKNDTLILDLKYYFTGSINKINFFISCMFALMEEIVFRLFLIKVEEHLILILIFTSICFGIIHYFFSKYDCFSKCVLGLILGIILIITKNIIYLAIVHIVYNYFALKIKC